MNTTRITGLFSGIDTDALVKAMSMNQQRKVDALSARKTEAEWKKDLLTDLNNKIRVFRDTYGSVLGENNLMSRGAYTSFSVQIAANTGVNVVASASAKAGSYNIRVDQVATAATMRGDKLTTRSTGLTEAEINNTALNRLAPILTGGTSFSDNIRFSINGRDFQFSAANTTLKRIMDEVNRAAVGVTMAYSQTTDSVTITSNVTGVYNPPRSLDFSTDADYRAAVQAYENAHSGKRIDFTDSSGFLASFGLTGVSAGQDAIVHINGESDPRHLDSNNITLDGIQMSFLRPTDESGVDYTLVADHKPTVDRVRQMVDAFNTLFGELYTTYNQRSDRNFRPLTAEQRSEMSEKEIDQWEVRAREGLMYRDNTLNKLLEGLRATFTTAFGNYGNLSSIGITPGRYMIGEPSLLEFDADKFLAALQADPNRIYDLMTAPESVGGGGFMTRVNKLMDSFVNTIKGRELQNLNNDIHNFTKNIKEQEDKLTEMSEKYYLQYAKLETALGQLQNQHNQMATMFGWNNQQT
jgi:flagellar hook-associated protein 2